MVIRLYKDKDHAYVEYTCAICSLEDVSTLKPGKIKNTGYAASSGGRDIKRVDASVDRGESRIEASRYQKSSLYAEVRDVFGGFWLSSSISHAVPVPTRPIHFADAQDSVGVELSEFDSDYVVDTGSSNDSESYRSMCRILQLVEIYSDWEESYNKIFILLQALSHSLSGAIHDRVLVPHYNRNMIERDFSNLDKVFWDFPPCIEAFKIGRFQTSYLVKPERI
ncbi:hypothetical protein Ahy_A10g048552 [Arachis hypogaea]|uniref:Moybdenum cofactor oxidoreductase dimerisation domain-containing protein n=1 Tax=Arachis hypogaea TaxID=3818 RepID=A0A445B5C9_ARAHY|nr:hypothetical protein Ahy_A10g048552 [Arachis hypogaea]